MERSLRMSSHRLAELNCTEIIASKCTHVIRLEISLRSKEAITWRPAAILNIHGKLDLAIVGLDRNISGFSVHTIPDS